MRTFVVTLLVIFGVVFGSTHASAFQHSDGDASTIFQAGLHAHADIDHDDDGSEGSNQVGSEVGTHNHGAMDRTGSSAGFTGPVRDKSKAIRPPATPALSSLDQAPPLEPPSA